MKSTITSLLMIVTAFLIAELDLAFAQARDTVIVYANPPGTLGGGHTIEQFIMGDTTATGRRNNPNRVYVLQQTASVDTPYYYQDPIYVKNYNLTIIGKRNPITGMPPVIQPFPRQNNTSPSNFLSASGVDTITLKNLYFLGQRYDSIQATGNLLQINGDSNRVTVDHIVLDNASGTFVNFASTANHSSLFATNCEMRNVSNQFWRSGVLMWANNGVPIDTLLIQNCTFFALGRCIFGTPGYIGTVILDHNTVFFSSDAPILASRMTNMTVTNNIFFGVCAHGADSAYIATGNTNDAHEPYGLITVDSLKTVGSTYGITEAQRHIVVTNNDYFWPEKLLSFWKAINDTATNWYVAPPMWMNPSTAAKFSDKKNWPNLYAANNDSVDPGFSPSLVASTVDSLIKFETMVGWNTPWGGIGNAGSFRWWQLWTDPYPSAIFDQFPANWRGWSEGYPVPENLAYSNDSLQQAGLNNYALGDLNWYPTQLAMWEKGGVNSVQSGPQLPTKFDLSNNYPNPFNPSTNIRVSLKEKGVMSLTIYNILGEVVQIVDRGYKTAGEYTYNINMNKFASGVYFYTLRQGTNSITKKMLLLK